MCQKQPDAICCGCCTPKKVAASTAVIGGAILVASFVIAAVLLTMLQDGLHNTVRYNSPRTDLKAYNDWLTSDPSKKSNGDAAAQYKAYYFFNVTNLDEIVAAGINLAGTQVVPIVQEIGPYYYRYWSEIFDVSWEGNDDRVTFQKYNRYDWQPSMSKMGGVQLDAYTDYIIQPSILYSTVFGNPFFTALYGLPEYAVRVGFAGLAPLVYVQYSPTLAASLGYSSPFAANAGASTFVLHTLLSSQYLASVQSGGITTTRAGFLAAMPSRAAGCPEFEYWAFVDNVLAPQGVNTTGLKFTVSQAPYLGGFYVAGSFPSSLPGCPQMDFKSNGAIGCWISPQVTPAVILATTPSLAALFTVEQIGGLQQYLRYEYQYLFDFLWSSMGHLGKAYATLFTGTCNPSYPSTNSTCPVWNTANAWVRQSVHNLLFENFHFFGPLLASALPTPPKRPMNIAYFHNRTSYDDARLDKNIITVGTGINDIADVDNLYRYWNGTGLPTTGGSAIFCTSASDPRYTLNGEYKYQTMDLTGQTFRNTAQAKMTKYSPQFPPGRVNDNRFRFGTSVVEEGLVFDVWVSDIARHAHMTYTHSDTIKGIDVLRFTIGDEDYAIDPFFGQYHYALANYSCPGNGGPVAFSSIPRYGKLDKQELSSVMDLATIVPIPDATFKADGPAPFSDPSDFTPSLLMEPISGAQIAGSLKVQFNLQYDPWIGMPKQLYFAAYPFAGGSVPKRKSVLIPVYWQNKYGVLTDKQASTFKDTVYAAKTASRVVLIVGTIVGGLLFLISLVSLVMLFRRQAYKTQTSQSNDLAL